MAGVVPGPQLNAHPLLCLHVVPHDILAAAQPICQSRTSHTEAVDSESILQHIPADATSVLVIISDTG
eukprot:2996974-Rhodomonas_salina.2